MKPLAKRVLRALLPHAEATSHFDRALGFAPRPPSKTLIVGVGLARSGKRWLSEIFNRHTNAASLAEPYPLLESYFFYCQWNGLAVDHAGFFHRLNADINRLFDRHDVVYVASPWLSLGLQQIERFLQPDAYFFSVRRPDAVVRSMVAKGWYAEDLVREEHLLPSGPQPFLNDAHHHFSRVTPMGEAYEAWQRLTPVGRCAWYWNEANVRIERELGKLPSSRVFHVRLQDIDQNYAFYRNVAAHFGLRPTLTKGEFEAIKGRMSNIGRKSSRAWSGREQREFDQQIAVFGGVFEQLQTSFLQDVSTEER